MNPTEKSYIWPYQFSLLEDLVQSGAVDIKEGDVSLEQASEVVGQKNRAVEFYEDGDVSLGRLAYRRAVADLVGNQIVPVDLAVRIGRRLRPSDVIAGGVSTSFFTDFYCPEKRRQRDIVVWGNLRGKGSFCLLEEVVGREKMETINRASVAGHEYGHEIQIALQWLILEKAFGKDQLNKFSSGEWADLANYAHCALLGLVDSVSPIEEKWGESGERIGLEPQDYYRVQIERISTGCEMAVLKAELKKNGIDPEMVQTEVDGMREMMRRGGVRAAELLTDFYENGWKITDICRLLTEINRYMVSCREGRVLNTRIGTVDLGYSFPLEGGEIGRLVEEVYGQNW